MRQKGYKKFAKALNRLAQGCCTDDDVKMFETRVFTEQTLPQEGKAANRIAYSNDGVNHYNTVRAILLKKPGEAYPYAVSEAVDTIAGYRNETEKRQTKHNLQGKPSNKTQGLPEKLILQYNIGCTYRDYLKYITRLPLIMSSIGLTHLLF